LERHAGPLKVVTLQLTILKRDFQTKSCSREKRASEADFANIVPLRPVEIHLG
jgi:hypothetical protein